MSIIDFEIEPIIKDCDIKDFFDTNIAYTIILNKVIQIEIKDIKQSFINNKLLDTLVEYSYKKRTWYGKKETRPIASYFSDNYYSTYNPKNCLKLENVFPNEKLAKEYLNSMK